MISTATQLAVQHNDLTENTVFSVMDEILSGKASDIQIAAYLTAMSAKPESIDEIAHSVIGFRKHYRPLFNGKDAIEIIGTGGDNSGSFNISTTTAFLIASTGISVIKHGNRAATSKSGSADVLEALGVRLSQSEIQIQHTLDTCNICFLYNQDYPTIMKSVSHIRHELDFVTIFNKIRWINPGGANYEMLGVYKREYVIPLATALAKTGIKNAIVVHGLDGLDEISISNDTFVCEVVDGKLHSYVISPKDYGFDCYEKNDLKGGTPEENAQLCRDILSGRENGAKRDIVLLNAAFGMHVVNPRYSINESIEMLKQRIDSGDAIKKLDQFILATNM